MKPGGSALILLSESFKYIIRHCGKDLLSGLSLSTHKALFSEFLLCSLVYIYGSTTSYFQRKNKQTNNNETHTIPKKGTNRTSEKSVLVCFRSQLHILHLHKIIVHGFFVSQSCAGFLKGIQYL